MAVAFDAVASSAFITSGTSFTWSHTLSASATDIVVVVGTGADDPATTLTVKVGSTSMTSLGLVHCNNSNLGFVQVFGLTSPPTGTQTITVTSTVTFGTNNGSTGVAQDAVAGSMSFTGSNGYGTVVTAFGNNATAQATISTTTSGNMCVAGVATGTSVTSSSNTSRFINNGNNSSAANNCAGSTAASTGSSVLMKWTVASDYWGVVAFEVVQAVTSPTVHPGVANVTVAALQPVAVVPSPPPGDTRQQQILYLYDLYGQAIFPVPLPPSVAAGAFPTVAPVTVASYPPTVAVTGLPPAANVTPAGQQPSVSISITAGVANVTVAGLAPSTPIVFTTGVANVTVAGLNPTPLVTAFPSTAPVNVAAYNAMANIGGNVTATPTVANVTVSGLDANNPQVTALPTQAGVTVTHGLDVTPQVTALPGAPNVLVVAYNQAVTIAGSVTVTPGVANVTVVTLAATTPGTGIANDVHLTFLLLASRWVLIPGAPRWATGPVGSRWIMVGAPARWSMGS